MADLRSVSSVLSNYDSMFGDDGTDHERVILDIELDKLIPFAEHPFRVRDDEEMESLCHSIERDGIRTPLMVRESSENPGCYEILSGHRRSFAARKLGLETVPCSVEEVEDDYQAALIMADANKQRTPTCMDKARTYRLLIKRYDIRMGERDTDEKNEAKSTRAVVAEMLSVSEGTIQKYLRFLRLNESLQNMLEEGYFNVNVAEMLSFLSAPVQDIVICYLMENGKGSIREENAKNLRNNPLADRLDRTSVYEILSGKKARKSRGASPKKLLLNEKKLNKYFPPEYTSKQVQEVTEFLFEHYLQEGIAAWKATKSKTMDE